MAMLRTGTMGVGNVHTGEVVQPTMSSIEAVLEDLNRSLALLGDTWRMVYERLTPVLLPESPLTPEENVKLCGSPSPLVTRLRGEINTIRDLTSEMQDVMNRLEL